MFGFHFGKKDDREKRDDGFVAPIASDTTEVHDEVDLDEGTDVSSDAGTDGGGDGGGGGD